MPNFELRAELGGEARLSRSRSDRAVEQQTRSHLPESNESGRPIMDTISFFRRRSTFLSVLGFSPRTKAGRSADDEPTAPAPVISLSFRLGSHSLSFSPSGCLPAFQFLPSFLPPSFLPLDCHAAEKCAIIDGLRLAAAAAAASDGDDVR